MIDLLIVMWLIGFIIVAASMARWVYRAWMDSFHDGILMTFFTIVLGTLFIPLSVLGMIVIGFNTITGREIR